MTNTVGKVSIDLEARLAKFESDMGRAARIAAKETERMRVQVSSQLRRMNDQAAKSAATFKNTILGAFGGLSAGVVLRELQQAADGYANVQAKLRLVTADQAGLGRAMGETLRISRDTFTSLDATATLVARTTRALTSQGQTAEQALSTSLRLTETINQAFAVSGASTAEQQAAIIQLSQALASGVLRGEEFNSISEQGSRITQALAQSLGVTTGELRAMAKEGKLTTEVVTNALLAQSAAIETEFGKVPLTIGRAFQLLTIEFQAYIGQADQASGTSRKVAEAIADIARNLPAIISAVVTATKVWAAYFAIFKAAPALYAAATAGLIAHKNALVSASISAELGIKTALTFGSVMKALGSVLLVAFTSFEIGTYLSENFAEARIAGAYLVDSLLVGWERIKQGAMIAWLALEAGFMGAIGNMRAALADFIGGFASSFESLPAVLRSGISMQLGINPQVMDAAIGKMKSLEASIRPTKEAGEGLAASFARINSEAEANIAVIRENTNGMINFEYASMSAAKSSNALGDAEKLAAEAAAALAKAQADGEKAATEATKAKGALAAASKAERAAASAATKEWEEQEDTLHGVIEANERYAEAKAELFADYDSILRAYEQEIDYLTMDEETRRDLELQLRAEAEVRELLNRIKQQGLNLDPETIASMEQEIRLRNQALAETEKQVAAAAPFKSAWQDAVMSVTDAFADFVSGNIKSFKDFGKSLESIAKQFLSNLIKQFLSTNLRVGGVTIPGAQGGGGGGGMGGGSVFGAGAGSLGFAGAGAALGYSQYGGAGAVLGGVAGLAAYGAVAGAGGLGLGIGAGSAAAAAGTAAGGGLAGAGAGAAAAVPVVGWIVAGLALLYTALQDTTKRITVIGRELVGTQGFRNLAPDAIRDSALGGFAFASADNISREERDQLAQGIQAFDASIAQLLDSEQLERVRAAVAQVNTQAEEGAISVQTFIARRMDAITGAFDEAVQEFVRSGGDLEAQVERLGFALAVQRDVDAGVDPFGLEGGLGAVLSLIEDMAGPSEEMAAAYQRIAGATQLLDAALAMSGIELGKTREEVIQFAASIADAAGGLQQATDLWSAYFDGFYTEAERAQMALDQANKDRDAALGTIGLGTDTTREQFRQAFEEALPTLTPEQVANWLRAGAAIVRADQAIEGLGGSLEEVAVDARLAGDALEQAFDDARGVAEDLFGSPLDQINEQISALEGQRDAWQQAQDAADQFWEAQRQALAGLRQQADDLLLGEFSPLRGEAKVEEALRQFNAALASGDFGRAQSLSGTVLSAGRDARASGRDFNELFQYVQTRLRTQGPVGSAPTVPPFDFDALNALYTERDRLLLEQENAYRQGLAEDLAEYIAQIAFSTGRPLEDIAAELGFSLPQLAAILGLTLEELRAYVGSLLPEGGALVDSQTFTGGRPPTLPVEAPNPVYAGAGTAPSSAPMGSDPESRSLLRDIRDELRRPSGGNRRLTRA